MRSRNLTVKAKEEPECDSTEIGYRFSTGQMPNVSISVEVHICVISFGSAALQGGLACTKYMVSLLELHSSEM